MKRRSPHGDAHEAVLTKLGHKWDEAIMDMMFPERPELRPPTAPCPECRDMGGLILHCPKHMVA